MLDKYLTGRLIVVKDKTEIATEKEIVTISADNLNKKTAFFYDSERPVLNENELAVFGPDYESVEDYINSLNITEEDDIHGPIKEDEELLVASYSFKEGNVAYYFRKPEMVVSSKCILHRHSSSALNDLRVRVWENNGKYHLETSSQWPMQIRNNVAEELGVEVDRVIFHSVHYHDTYDEYLNIPTKAAIVAASAAKKTGMSVELIVTPTAVQPEVQIDISSAFDKNKSCKALKINAVVDLGLYPRLSQEYLLHLVSGLIPVYKVTAIEINAKAYKSEHATAGFYSDLGYSIGLAAIENHFSKLAKKLDVQPTEWRIKNVFKNRFAEQFKKSSQFASLKQTLEECTQASHFERKHSVGSYGVNPFINYARGIGISCGEGTQGFSNSFTALKDYSISISASEDKKVKISCGLVPDMFLADILSDIVKRELGDDIESITFGENENIDFGPSVLGRKVKYIPILVEKGCRELKDKTWPCSCTIPLVNEKKDYLFEADTFGTLILELHIDPVLLIPVVDHIFARLKFGQIYDKVRIQRMIRQVITSTVKEICPAAENNFDIDLVVQSDENFPAGSASSLIRGLTIASFASAISQALNHDLKKLPLRDKDILGITILDNEN